MSDTADLPDISTLQPAELPDVGSLLPAPMRDRRAVPTYPGAILNRLTKGNAVTPVIQKLGQGFATGYGNAFTSITADDEQKMKDAGFFATEPGYFSGGMGALRFMRNQLGAAATFIKAGTLSLFPAVVEATQQGVTELAKQVGADASIGGTAERIGREAGSAVEFMGTDLHMQTLLMNHSVYNQVTKMEPLPDGSWHDVNLGHVPTPDEAVAQATKIADYHGLDIAPAIQKSYDAGVLPVEIHSDIAAHPEILSDLVAGEVPKAYPVTDWTGSPVKPPAKPAGEPGAVPATQPPPNAPEGTTPGTQPLPTTGPTRLRPISDTNETTVSGLAESVEASAVNKQLVENFGDLPELGVAKDATQGPKAVALLNKDPELSRSIAMGQQQPPPGTLASAVFVAVKNRAETTGDLELLRQLGTQSQFLGQVRRMGQETSYLRNVNSELDTVSAVNQVQEARRAALKARGIDAAAEIEKNVQEALPIVRAARAPKPNAWNAFIASIQCAE